MNPAQHAVASAGDIDEDGWRRVHHELLGDLPRRTCWAPHLDAIQRRAFPAVRHRLLHPGADTPAAPLPYFVPKSNRSDRGAPQRRHCLLQPVEETAWLLLAATAIARCEPVLDRQRVLSSRPAAADQPGLFTRPEEWTRAFSARVDGTTARADAVARLDVVRCGERIGRDRLLRILEEVGLAAGWLAVARRLLGSCTETLGPAGLPITGFVTAGFVTIMLAPIDRWCAGAGAVSARMMDDTVIAAPDLATADRLAQGAGAVLAANGFDATPETVILQTTAAFREERRRERARMPDAAWSCDAARAQLLATPEDDPRFLPIADAALARLAADADASALSHVLGRFPHAPAAARTFAIHVARFMEDPAVGDGMAAMLVTAGPKLHPWQWSWGISTFRRAPRVRANVLRALFGLLADERVPEPVRIAAAAVGSRFATRNDWTELARLAGTTRSRHVRAAIAWGLVHRPAAERRPLLREWAPRDPLIALVAAALEPAGDNSA
ncbi:hypothetical protein STAQ_49380 [Allostella sp. ATCC 35155]|nr:hypothetical protein STAQ_49380 [Stella sp. ATCC 35155]